MDSWIPKRSQNPCALFRHLINISIRLNRYKPLCINNSVVQVTFLPFHDKSSKSHMVSVAEKLNSTKGAGKDISRCSVASKVMARGCTYLYSILYTHLIIIPFDLNYFTITLQYKHSTDSIQIFIGYMVLVQRSQQTCAYNAPTKI
jgi:hypothetical protein